MVNLHLLIGIPGSGKTTYANELIKQHNYKIVSTDIVRANHPGIVEDDVWPTVYKMLGELLQHGTDCIFDATSITPKVRKRLIDNIKNYSSLELNKDYNIISYYFPTSTNVCIKRVALRNQINGELFLPLEVISSYGEKIIAPTYEEKFLETKVVSGASDLLQGLISDSFQGYAFYFKYNDLIIEEYNGFNNIETYEPIRESSCFRLASVSKQFIAYAILSLLNKSDKFSLDCKLYDMFDNMPLYTKEITIRNMLNHTSGLLDYEDMPHTEEQIHDENVLDYIRTTNHTYFKTGSKYQYSNTAYVLLGLIIERISGVKLGDYLDQIIFKPLGMINSMADYEPVTKICPRAYGHIRKNNFVYKKDQYWCSATIGDGGIYSNVYDLLKWLKHIRKLNEYPFNQMKEPNYINNVNTEYGFGLRIRDYNEHKIIYHCGETIGTNTIIGFIEDLDLEFVFLTNENGINTAKFIDNLIRYLK